VSHHRPYIANVQGHRSKVKVTGSKAKLTAKNAIIRQWIVQRLQTWHGVVIKAGKDWRGVK